MPGRCRSSVMLITSSPISGSGNRLEAWRLGGVRTDGLVLVPALGGSRLWSTCRSRAPRVAALAGDLGVGLHPARKQLRATPASTVRTKVDIKAAEQADPDNPVTSTGVADFGVRSQVDVRFVTPVTIRAGNSAPPRSFRNHGDDPHRQPRPNTFVS